MHNVHNIRNTHQYMYCEHGFRLYISTCVYHQLCIIHREFVVQLMRPGIGLTASCTIGDFMVFIHQGVRN